MSQPIITVEGAGRRYGTREVLQDVHLQLHAGEMLLVTGHSGAGKSTLLKLLAAIEVPSAGRVVISGQDTRAISPAALPYLRRRFGVVFQDHKLLEDRNALRNVLLPLEITGFDRREARRRARAALERVGLLARERSLPVALSGGEQQRLCIARAIVHRPAVLVADEPTGNLDPDYAREIVELFRSFHALGTTVVLATHDAMAIRELAGRVLVLREGRLQ